MSTNNEPIPTELEKVEKILATLVGFDTVSRHSNRALIDWIKNYLNDLGVKSEIVASDDGSKACLWATIGSSNKNGIVLAGHSDVVPVDGQKWDSDPFTLTERDGKLFARGSADMKGFIACILAFVPEFLATRTDSCFHIALTSDEETDMSGAMRLTDYLSKRNVKPEWIWVGEPTGLTIVDQHKGVSYYRTRITGVSGHSGFPDKGLNALSLATKFMTMIEDAAQTRQNKPVPSSVFDTPYTTFNLATIKGGSAENIIAGECEVSWQLCAHPGDVAQEIVDTITAQADAAFAPSFAKFAPQIGKEGPGMETCTCFDIPPFTPDGDNAGSKTLKRALKCDETHAAGFATEAGIFQKLGASAVVCGPGFIAQAHQPNEYIDKSQLTACVDLMRAVLLCSSARET